MSKLYSLISAVGNFLWMVYNTHHVGGIWCTQKPEGVHKAIIVKNIIIVMIAFPLYTEGHIFP